MIKKLILGAAAALIFVGSAGAAELWAGVRNGFGEVSLGQYDTETGHLVAGSNVFMDTSVPGQPAQPVAFDRLGALAFDSDGALWAGVRNGFGNVSLARYDTATGRLVAGSNVFMDTSVPGQPAQPVAFDRLGALAFDSDGALWAGVRNGFGNVSLARYDTATGHLVGNSNVFMDASVLGQPAQPVAFDRLGALAFDSDGALWAGVRNGFGNVSLARYDTATGHLVAGSNVFMDASVLGQPAQPVAFDRLGALAFDNDGALWAAVRNGFGNVSLARYDTATGRLVTGSNVFMDTSVLGQPAQPVGFDRLGAMAFTPDAAPVSGVPEPSSWALLIAGFFLTGVASRWRAADRRSSLRAPAEPRPQPLRV